MSGISSYAIKVTAIHRYLKDGGYRWTDGNLVDRVLDTLELLKDYLGSGSGIPCLWDSKNDLLGDMHSETRRLQSRYLTTAIDRLKENRRGPDCAKVWDKYFPTS